MVSNHIVDLIERYGTDGSASSRRRSPTTSRRAKFYDYNDHSRVGAAHGEFVTDEICDRFCVLGTVEQAKAKLQRAPGGRRRPVQHLPHDPRAGGDAAGVRRRDHPRALRDPCLASVNSSSSARRTRSRGRRTARRCSSPRTCRACVSSSRCRPTAASSTQLTDYAEPVDGFYLPDGRVLVEIDEAGNERTQLHILGEGALVSDPRFNHWTPHVSRDGRLLAYTTNRRNGRDFDVVVRELASGEETELRARRLRRGRLDLAGRPLGRRGARQRARRRLRISS